MFTLEERISKIPGDEGWWKESSESTFIKLAEMLIAQGFTEDEAVAFLESAYHVTAECFGA